MCINKKYKYIFKQTNVCYIIFLILKTNKSCVICENFTATFVVIHVTFVINT